MITSTITRPTSIATTTSCDQKVSLVETVDIGPMVPPKPRTISLEPIAKRSRSTRKKRTSAKGRESEPQETLVSGVVNEGAQTTASTSPRPDDSASQCGSVEPGSNLRSPAQSDVISTVSAATSTESSTSNSTGMSFRLGPVPSSAKSSSQLGSKVSRADKTITATIELLRSGCLPGETLPLKISIKHTKAIKSMHGIIITLYRQGRIDSAPPLSLFVDIKGKEAQRLKHEEYYPKSKTGLGGLSLSSAGSSSLFRKDLAQTFAPILVDPSTLTAVVNASVRVPEDVFPTISGVPGEMISFRYHVEVVVDLGGKLAGQQRHVPRVGTITLPSSFGGSTTRGGDGAPNMLTAWGGSIVDTDHIRREKSVVACLFEVTVGSTDSARKRGRGNSKMRKQMNDWPEEPLSPTSMHDPIYEELARPNETEPQSPRGPEPPYQYYDENYEEHYPEYYEGYNYQQNHESYPQNLPPPTHHHVLVPPPEFPAEEGLNEKERARRAEERLLPSQPPQALTSPSSSRAAIPLSAPSAPQEGEIEDLYGAEDSNPHSLPATTSPAGQSSTSPEPPSAPTLEDLNPHSEANPTDDKQELERRRMLTEASAPSHFRADEDDNGGEGSSGAHHEPLVPTLTEEDEYGGQYSHHALPASASGSADHREELPRYER